ncbi:FmdB family zinc ribbon protein [Caldicellulosiruptor morganii]|uniref:Zinc ribbon domain-containing protein n=1 Tax=Caldicellulosiruptor morganii TaxID=1387555 RepID=A0ABY7BKB8_9FIRM|nr:FmdB family zinc ribbon protein [Caldicellulosiruptor morganii]WAM33263.1 zinc ribbon domain-containing protein [Caldicellulosiruptor morganii]
MYYTFICNKCEEVFEINASISEISNGLKVICPKCSSDDVRRDYSRINFGISAANSSNTQSCSSCSGNRGCCGS